MTPPSNRLRRLTAEDVLPLAALVADVRGLDRLRLFLPPPPRVKSEIENLTSEITGPLSPSKE